MSATTEEALYACSFCNKTNKLVKKLIAGPGVYICDECVGLCNNILTEAAQLDDAPPPSLEDAPVEQLVSIFRGMAGTAARMESNLQRWAERLHRRGITIARIAVETGMSEEEAARRFNL